MLPHTANAPIAIVAGLTDAQAAAARSEQERYDLVMAHSLAGAISLSRAVELLDIAWVDLRARVVRFDVPLRTVPANIAEAQVDVEVAQLVG